MYSEIEAELYDRIVGLGYHNQSKNIRDILRIIPRGSSALELGVGTGMISSRLIEAGIDAEGIDSSGPMLNMLVKNHPEMVGKVHHADIADYVPEKKYDFIFSCNGPIVIKEGEIESYIGDENALISSISRYADLSENGLYLGEGKSKPHYRLKLSNDEDFIHAEKRVGDIIKSVSAVVTRNEVIPMFHEKRRYDKDKLLSRYNVDKVKGFYRIRTRFKISR